MTSVDRLRGPPRPIHVAAGRHACSALPLSLSFSLSLSLSPCSLAPAPTAPRCAGPARLPRPVAAPWPRACHLHAIGRRGAPRRPPCPAPMLGSLAALRRRPATLRRHRGGEAGEGSTFAAAALPCLAKAAYPRQRGMQGTGRRSSAMEGAGEAGGEKAAGSGDLQGRPRGGGGPRRRAQAGRATCWGGRRGSHSRRSTRTRGRREDPPGRGGKHVRRGRSALPRHGRPASPAGDAGDRATQLGDGGSRGSRR